MSDLPRTLSERCLDNVVPEPIQLTQDSEGQMHFATAVLPLRTIIDVHSLPVGFGWLKRDGHKIILTCDGRTVTYRKVGRDIHGHWICQNEGET